MRSIILFDGDCSFCNQSVQFILARDAHARFVFGSLQSMEGQRLLRAAAVPPLLDTLVLLENGRPYRYSSAALRIAMRLNGLWKLFALFLLIPRPLRDGAYRIFAKHRHRWFGKQAVCLLPPPHMKHRFLSD